MFSKFHEKIVLKLLVRRKFEKPKKYQSLLLLRIWCRFDVLVSLPKFLGTKMPLSISEKTISLVCKKSICFMRIRFFYHTFSNILNWSNCLFHFQMFILILSKTKMRCRFANCKVKKDDLISFCFFCTSADIFLNFLKRYLFKVVYFQLSRKNNVENDCMSQ